MTARTDPSNTGVHGPAHNLWTSPGTRACQRVETSGERSARGRADLATAQISWDDGRHVPVDKEKSRNSRLVGHMRGLLTKVVCMAPHRSEDRGLRDLCPMTISVSIGSMVGTAGVTPTARRR